MVSPVYRAEACVSELCTRLVAVLERLGHPFEIILVEDGSPDRSWAEIEKATRRWQQVKGVQLARNFGQHQAIAAGLTESRGAWVVVMDCDLQDRPEEIPRLYAKAQEGHLCVMSRRRTRTEKWTKRLQSRAFYAVFAYLTDIAYDGSVSNFSISARQVVDQINSMPESVRYFPGFLFWLGFADAFIEVDQDPRFAGASSYTFTRLMMHAQNIILSYSNKPLYLSVAVGAAMAGFSFLAGLFYLGWVVTYGSAVSGWPSLIISLHFIGGVMMFTLGVVGLYVGRVFAEVKQRPSFVVRKRSQHG